MAAQVVKSRLQLQGELKAKGHYVVAYRYEYLTFFLHHIRYRYHHRTLIAFIIVDLKTHSLEFFGFIGTVDTNLLG